MSKKDYYQVLGLGKDASADEIKKAFRRQAVKHHPDRGGDEAKFKEINEAHEVLSNPEKKQRYDQFGEAGLGGSSQGFSSSQGFGSGSQGFSFNFGDEGFGDIFSSFFGDFAGQRASAGNRTNLDIETSLNLEFSEAVFGVEKTLVLNINDVCPHCSGKRAEPGSKLTKCETCKGSGQQARILRTPLGNFRQQMTCQTCQGQGEKIESPCSVCKAAGVKPAEREVSIAIPAGVDDGATIRLREKGEKNHLNQAGDLYVIIQVKPDKHFTREGDLILSEESITMAQAALGCDINVKTVEGDVKIKIPAGTQPGTDFKLAKLGVPHLKGGGRGDHIVSIVVDIPKKLNSKQKQILKEFDKS